MGNQYKEGKSDEEIKYIERVESTDMFYTKTKPLYLLGNLEMRFFVTHKNRSYIRKIKFNQKLLHLKLDGIPFF